MSLKNIYSKDKVIEWLESILGEEDMSREDLLKIESILGLLRRKWTLPALLALEELEDKDGQVFPKFVHIYWRTISFGASLNWNKFMDFMNKLYEIGLVEKKVEGKDVYFKLTEKGRKVLEAYKEFVKQIASLY